MKRMGKVIGSSLFSLLLLLGLGIADADYRSCFAANDGCSK